MGAKADQGAKHDYWLTFCKSENMPPSKMLNNTPDSELGMLALLKGCEQDKEWHPEGDAWRHTGQVCDMMLSICREEGVSGEEQQILMMAALLHDNAKPETTFRRYRDGVERIVSPGHAAKGAPKALKWLLEHEFNPGFAGVVASMVKCHMRHIDFREGQKDPYGAVYELARDIRPGSLCLLAKLVTADLSGRVANPADLKRLVAPHVEKMMQLATQCQVENGVRR